MRNRPARKKPSPPESVELDSTAERGEIAHREQRVLSAFDRRRVTAPVHDEKIHGPSMVQQHFKDECDINRIILKFTETGYLSHQMPGMPTFGEAPAISFTDAMFMVTDAQEKFGQLPAEIRSEFNNDPAQFLDAFQDPENRGRLEELGLIDSKAPAEAVLVRLEGDMPGTTPPGETPEPASEAS